MAGQLSTQSTIGAWFVARRGVAMTATMFIGKFRFFCLPSSRRSSAPAAWHSGWYHRRLECPMIPVALLLVKNKPSDLGQLPDGASGAGDMAEKRKDFKVFKREKSLAFPQVLRPPPSGSLPSRRRRICSLQLCHVPGHDSLHDNWHRALRRGHGRFRHGRREPWESSSWGRCPTGSSRCASSAFPPCSSPREY